MTFVFQENSVINWPHVRIWCFFYPIGTNTHHTSVFVCVCVFAGLSPIRVSIWFSLFTRRVCCHSRKSHKSIFHHDEWNRYGRSIARNVYGSASVILPLYHLFGSSIQLYRYRYIWEWGKNEIIFDFFHRFFCSFVFGNASDRKLIPLFVLRNHFIYFRFLLS